MNIIKKYRLKKDLPDLSAGVIFEHREYDINFPDRGNRGNGVMILGWLNENCQDGWAGESYILPGQLAKNKEWFEPINEIDKETLKNQIEESEMKVKNFKNQVKKLEMEIKNLKNQIEKFMED